MIVLLQKEMTDLNNILSKEHFAFNDDNLGFVLNATTEVYLLVDADLTILYHNNAASKLVEKLLAIEVKNGMNVLELYPEHQHVYLRNVYNYSLQGHAQKTESEHTQKNGSKIYLQHTFTPAINVRNKIVGVLVRSENITLKKTLELQLEESEERWRFALEAANQGAWDWDIQSDKMLFSDSYKALYGFMQDDISHNYIELQSRIHPDDAERVKATVDQHFSLSVPVYECTYRLKNKKDEYQWVLDRGRIINRTEDGKPLRMIGTHTDLTKTLEAKEKYEKLNERFTFMMKATNELLWDWDIKQDYIFRSREGLRVFGVTDDGSMKKMNTWIERVHDDDKDKIYTIINSLDAAKHEQTFEVEYRFKKDDGDYTFVYDRGILLKDENNKPQRIIGSAQNISERKNLEAEILKQEIEYKKLINQATVDSQEQQRAEIGKELHDNINQVLTTTKLYLELALNKNELTEELIQKSNANLTQAIIELRQLSRSLMDPSIGDLGITDALQDLIETINLTHKLKATLSVDKSLDDELDDRQMLAVFRIVQEALNNVLKHAEAGKVTVQILNHQQTVLLSITDDGKGFQHEVIKRGAGLKNITNRVYLINGTFTLDSKPGKGCQIDISFPITTN